MKILKVRRKDMKDGYREFTAEAWSESKALPKIWEAAWSMAIDSVNCRKIFGYYEPEYPIPVMDSNYDEHLGCYSYPNCDIDPNGCCVLNGMDATPYGHRD